MFTKDKAMEILKKALTYSDSDMAEAVLEKERLSLTRFAESRISDNIDNEQTTLYIRIAREKKIAVNATGDISVDGIKKAVNDCQTMLEFIPPDQNFVSFAKPEAGVQYNDVIKPALPEFGPGQRAEAIARINRIADKGKTKSSGAFRIDENSLAVANTLGIYRFFTRAQAELSLTLSGDFDNSGWAMQFHPDASQIDIDKIAQTALRKAAKSRDIISLESGQYTVILEPAAVGQLLLMLSFMGFGCQTFYQRRSFMSAKIGEQIAGNNFTVTEDPSDPDFNYCPFDYEGTVRKKTELITNGIAKGVVYNTYYANLMETLSTGNALAPTNSYGPYPKTLAVAPGDKTVEEMIQATEKGVYITHFWYINFLNPMATMVTGTTLDGTFLIENGKIGQPIKNMRTNQSLLEAFSNIEALSSGRIIYPQYSVLMKVPYMKINNFNLNVEEEEDNKC
ncbi:MAG: TldD/PmbA family protein [Candidatus Zixiibacteriota bacterium]